MTYLNFNRLVLFFIFFNFLYSNILGNEIIKIKSKIILDKKIPKECGIEFSVNKDIINISLIKTENDVEIFFYANNNLTLNSVNLITESINFKESFDRKKNDINGNKRSKFFQELLISGGTLHINRKKYIIEGPIDSKVRLEYLFCTGEMVHPKYDK